VVTLAGSLVTLLLVPAIPFVQLQSAKGKEVSLGEAIRAGFSKFWRFYGLAFCTALFVLGGLLLFIVPGLFMIKRYMLAPYYLYDRDLKVREAMQASAEDSRKVPGALWGLLGVQLGISLLGAVPILALVSALLSVLYYCAPAIRYFEIKDGLSKH